MKDKDQTDPQRPPSEFAGFIRRIGIDAFDRFARQKVDSPAGAASTGRPLHKLATLWLDMDPRDKARFFDQVIAAGQAAAAAAPAMIALATTRKARKAATEEGESPAEDKTTEKKKKKAKTAKADADAKSEDRKKKKERKGKEKEKKTKKDRKKQADG